MDDKEWQIEVSRQLGSIEMKLRLLDAIDDKLTLQNGRLRELEGAYQRGRGVLFMLGFMGFTGVLGFLGWLAKLAGLIRP